MTNKREFSPPPAGAVAYTVNETCFLLRVGRNKVYNLLRQQELTSVKLGRRTLVPAASVLGYLGRLGMEVGHV